LRALMQRGIEDDKRVPVNGIKESVDEAPGKYTHRPRIRGRSAGEWRESHADTGRK